MNPSTSQSMTHVHGMMLLTIVLASSSFPVGAAITHALEPAVLMFLRFVLAVLLFAPYVFIKHGWKLPTWQDFGRYATLSVPLVIFFWCMFESLRYTSALNTGALYTIVPGITGLYAFLINQERIGRRRTLGLALGILGALWINFRGDLESMIQFEFNRGDLIFLAGCFGMALYNPLVKRLYRNEPSEIMTFWTLFTGSLWLGVLSGSRVWDVQWAEVELTVYGGVLYLAFFSTLCTFFLVQYSTVRLGATKVASYTFLTPICVLLINVLIGKGTPAWLTLPGILFVLLAMLIIQQDTTILRQLKSAR